MSDRPIQRPASNSTARKAAAEDPTWCHPDADVRALVAEKCEQARAEGAVAALREVERRLEDCATWQTTRVGGGEGWLRVAIRRVREVAAVQAGEREHRLIPPTRDCAPPEPWRCTCGEWEDESGWTAEMNHRAHVTARADRLAPTTEGGTR